MAPAGAVAGPFSNDVLPQIFAGGALGHDPFGAGIVSLSLTVVGAGAIVVGGAEVVVGAVDGLAVVGSTVGDGWSVAAPPWVTAVSLARRSGPARSSWASATGWSVVLWPYWRRRIAHDGWRCGRPTTS